MICKRRLLSSPLKLFFFGARLCGDAAASRSRSRYSLAVFFRCGVGNETLSWDFPRHSPTPSLPAGVFVDVLCSLSFMLKVLALTAVSKGQDDASNAPRLKITPSFVLAGLHDHHVFPNS